MWRNENVFLDFIWILFTYFKLVSYQKANKKIIDNHQPSQTAED